jgi:DNA transformation protein
MSNPVSSITKMRATADADYARVGITTAEQLRELAADAAYLRLLQGGVRANFVDFCVLVLGLQGHASRENYQAGKRVLRPRFDAIKTAAKNNPSEIMLQNDRYAILNALGIVDRKR